jgi:hypothetical protein
MADEQAADIPPGNDPATSKACPAASGPDWDHHADDVFCPLCEYNLRGLIEPRCPECGYRFEWPDLFDPRRRLHPYLFEHHPESNFRSFWRTALGGWRPRRFWASLHPVQPSRPRRLITYWGLAASFAVLASVVLFISITVSTTQSLRILLGPAPAGQRGSPTLGSGSIAPSRRTLPLGDYLTCAGDVLRSARLIEPCTISLSVALAWPWMTFLSLLVFRWSMGRVRINRVHVLRCVVYCSDILIWYGLLLLVLAYPLAQAYSQSIWVTIRPRLFGYDVHAIRAAIAALAIGTGTYRLVVAYRRYLRFDHPVATVLASQLIVALAVFNAVLAYRVWP